MFLVNINLLFILLLQYISIPVILYNESIKISISFQILESSQLLLNMIKKEATNLDQTLLKANMDKQQY